MKVIFEAEIKDSIDGYTTVKDKKGEIIHYYENSTCLVLCNDDNMLYRVDMKKIKLQKRGLL